jgi:hypothetical protein
MAILYRHIRLDKNEPFYIGIGKSLRRAYRTDSRNEYWNNIAKNGYEVEIIFDDLSWEQACEKEKEFIKIYGRKDIGTGILSNMTDGGDGIDYTPQVRKKISDALFKNNPSKRIEVRQKISQSLIEYNKIHKQTHSEKTKKLLSDLNKGKIMTEESRKKMSESKKGKVSPRKGVILSDETKNKLRIANLGKKQSSETINKRVATMKNKKTIQ